jgi:hypothetical protein
MDMSAIEQRITEEAKNRASQMLEGFSITASLEPFGLDPETSITIAGPRKQQRPDNSVDLRLDKLDEAFRKAIFDALTRSIEDRLATQFAAQTQSIDLSTLVIPSEAPKKEVKSVNVPLNANSMKLNCGDIEKMFGRQKV